MHITMQQVSQAETASIDKIGHSRLTRQGATLNICTTKLATFPLSSAMCVAFCVLAVLMLLYETEHAALHMLHILSAHQLQVCLSNYSVYTDAHHDAASPKVSSG
jgi:hypothetical protein